MHFPPLASHSRHTCLPRLQVFHSLQAHHRADSFLSSDSLLKSNNSPPRHSSYKESDTLHRHTAQTPDIQKLLLTFQMQMRCHLLRRKNMCNLKPSCFHFSFQFAKHFIKFIFCLCYNIQRNTLIIRICYIIPLLQRRYPQFFILNHIRFICCF